MSITPNSPALIKQGQIQIWVTSRWKSLNPGLALGGNQHGRLLKFGAPGKFGAIRFNAPLEWTISSESRFWRKTRAAWCQVVLDIYSVESATVQGVADAAVANETPAAAGMEG